MGFWRGFITAFVVLEWLVLGWLLQAAPSMREMIAAFGSTQPPRIFVVVTSPEYAIGCLATLVGATALAGWLPRAPEARVLALAIVAVVTAVVVAVTWYGFYSPLFMLAGRIR